MVVSVAEGLGEGRGDYDRFGGGTKGFSAGHAGSVGKTRGNAARLMDTHLLADFMNDQTNPIAQRKTAQMRNSKSHPGETDSNYK